MTRTVLIVFMLLALVQHRWARSTSWGEAEEADRSVGYTRWRDSSWMGRRQEETREALRGGLQCGTLDLNSPLTSKCFPSDASHHAVCCVDIQLPEDKSKFTSLEKLIFLASSSSSFSWCACSVGICQKLGGRVEWVLSKVAQEPSKLSVEGASNEEKQAVKRTLSDLDEPPKSPDATPSRSSTAATAEVKRQKLTHEGFDVGLQGNSTRVLPPYYLNSQPPSKQQLPSNITDAARANGTVLKEYRPLDILHERVVNLSIPKHGTSTAASSARVQLEEESSESSIACLVCKDTGDAPKMLLCDGCDRGYHIYCLRPALNAIPDTDWFCSRCKNRDVQHRASDRSTKSAQRLPRSPSVEEESEDPSFNPDEQKSATSSYQILSDDFTNEQTASANVPDGAEVSSEHMCQVCESPEDEAKMLLCDRCNDGYHLYCLKPPLPRVPEGQWFCGGCLRAMQDGNWGGKWAVQSRERGFQAQDEDSSSTSSAKVVQSQTHVNRNSKSSPNKYVPLTANLIRKFLGNATTFCSVDQITRNRDKMLSANRQPVRETSTTLSDPPATPSSLLKSQFDPGGLEFVRCPRCSQMVRKRYVDSHIRDYGKRGVCSKTVSEREHGEHSQFFRPPPPIAQAHQRRLHESNEQSLQANQNDLYSELSSNSIAGSSYFIDRVRPKPPGTPAAAGKLPMEGMKPCKALKWEDCVICMESLEEDAVILRCKHVFHRQCVMRWVMEKEDRSSAHCPICRSDIS